MQLTVRMRCAMKNQVWMLLSAAVLLLPYFGNAQERGKEQLPIAAEHAKMRAQAEALRLPVAKESELRAEGNLVGFRSGEALFSHRRDSRTYFIQDLRPAQEKEEKTFQGAEKEYTERLNEVFRALEIPAAEISESRVLQEQTQEGHVDPSGRLVRGEPRAGKRWVTATRHVEGLPVFSSRALMALSPDGRVNFLELHWPVIPAETVQEAHRLQERVRARWSPPQLEGAHVESVEAGILHSPAISFVMDIHPVIRVTYAPDAKGLGKKAVRYVDLNGREVPAPRQFAQPLPAAQEKPRPRPEVIKPGVPPEVVKPI
jgi:hypothetical protein